MGDGSGPPNPYTYEARDYQLNEIRASIPWNQADGTINGPATVHRDPNCIWGHVIIGAPSGAHITLPVPVGDTVYTVAQLNAVGLTNISQVISLQITAIV